MKMINSQEVDAASHRPNCLEMADLISESSKEKTCEGRQGEANNHWAESGAMLPRSPISRALQKNWPVRECGEKEPITQN